MGSPMDAALNAVEWEETCHPEDVAMADDSVPWVTHKGVLRIAEFEFRCYQLNNGQRILDAEDVEAFFGVGSNASLSGASPLFGEASARSES